MIVCVIAIRNLYLIVTGILIYVESALLITGIIICVCYCWRRKNPKTIKVYHIIIDKSNTLSIEQSPQNTHQDIIIHDNVCLFISGTKYVS